MMLLPSTVRHFKGLLLGRGGPWQPLLRPRHSQRQLQGAPFLAASHTGRSSSSSSSRSRSSDRGSRSSSSSGSSRRLIEKQGGSELLAFATLGLSVCAVSWHNSSSSSSSSSISSRKSSSRICRCLSARGSAPAEVYVWGSNLDGQLGIDSGLSVSLPALLTSLPLRPKETVCAVSGGPRQSACITSEGRVFAWGRGGPPGEGNGLPSAAEGPREVNLPLQEGDRPVAVCCGSNHSLAVTEMGCLYSWGSNSHGQCGRPPFEAPQQLAEGGPQGPPPVEGLGYRDVFGGRAGGATSLPPGQVNGPLKGRKVRGASCGDRVSAAVTADGEIFVWGEARGGGGHLGAPGEKGPPNYEPRRVLLPPREQQAGGPAAGAAAAGAPKAVAVACGESHCLALTEDGRVYAWGSNTYGQLGVGGGPRAVDTPQLVTALKEHRVRAVSCGALHSLCLTEEGTVFVWGYGRDGQCAQPSRLDVPKPLQVEDAQGGGPLGGPHMGRCTHVSGGEGHSLAVCGRGRLFVWGRGREGQLGRGGLVESPAASRDSPVEVSLGSNRSVVTAACGGCHTIACVAANEG